MLFKLSMTRHITKLITSIRDNRVNEANHEQLLKATRKYVKAMQDELKAANDYIKVLETSSTPSPSLLKTALVTAPAIAVAAIATPTVAAPAAAIAAATGAIHLATK